MTLDNIHLQQESRKAQIMLLADYYPFGMLMPGRSFNSGDYRYGFNGMEKDDEIAGSGNSYTAEYWQYDSRLGRRWNVDPITYPWQSSYAAFNNNPIYFTDPLGLEGDPPTGGGGSMGPPTEGEWLGADNAWQTRNLDGSYTGEIAKPFEIPEMSVFAPQPLQTNTITNAMDNVRVDINRFIQDAVINEINNQINTENSDYDEKEKGLPIFGQGYLINEDINKADITGNPIDASDSGNPLFNFLDIFNYNPKGTDLKGKKQGDSLVVVTKSRITNEFFYKKAILDTNQSNKIKILNEKMTKEYFDEYK
jgi:RHS repeat-associated protein